MIGPARTVRYQGNQSMQHDLKRNRAQGFSYLRINRLVKSDEALRPRLAFRRTCRPGFCTSAWGLLLLFVALLPVSGCGKARPPGESAEEPFAAALAAVRPGEGRLAGSPWRSPASAVQSDLRKAVLRAAVRATARALTERLTVENLRKDAVVALLSGEGERSIAELLRASDLAPASAPVFNDLAVVRMARGSHDAYELFLALADANRAVKLNPALLEARFNRALALERLSLRERAALDWHYLKRYEPDRRWQREIEKRVKYADTGGGSGLNWQRDLQAVSQAAAQGDSRRIREIVGRSRQRFREHLEEVLLGQWALAQAQGRAAAALNDLMVARAIARALVETGGDPLGAETIGHIDRVRAAEPLKLLQLAAGFSAYHEGLELYLGTDFTGALSRFQQAETILAREGSPFADWPAFQIANCHYQLSTYQQAIAELAEIERRIGGKRRRALHGRVLWLRGLIETIEGSPTAALTAQSAAEADFRALGEQANTDRLSSMAAVSLDQLGQEKDAWKSASSRLARFGLIGRTQDTIYDLRGRVLAGSGTGGDRDCASFPGGSGPKRWALGAPPGIARGLPPPSHAPHDARQEQRGKRRSQAGPQAVGVPSRAKGPPKCRRRP